MRIRWLAVVLLIALLTGCQQVTWKEFSSSEGRFSVLMPGTPSEKTSKVNTEVGPVDMFSFRVTQEDSGYDVNYNDYPDAVVEASDAGSMLDGARDGIVSSLQGKLLTEFIISLDGYPGRDIRVEGPDGEHTVRTRLYLVDNRLYQLTVVTPKEDSFSKDVAKFLDSFELLEE
jgi:hypothetical protein